MTAAPRVTGLTALAERIERIERVPRGYSLLSVRM